MNLLVRLADSILLVTFSARYYRIRNNVNGGNAVAEAILFFSSPPLLAILLGSFVGQGELFIVSSHMLISAQSKFDTLLSYKRDFLRCTIFSNKFCTLL